MRLLGWVEEEEMVVGMYWMRDELLSVKIIYTHLSFPCMEQIHASINRILSLNIMFRYTPLKAV